MEVVHLRAAGASTSGAEKLKWTAMAHCLGFIALLATRNFALSVAKPSPGLARASAERA